MAATNMDRSSVTARVCTEWLTVLVAVTIIWKSGMAKLMSTAAMNRRGRRVRAVYCVNRLCPHMIRYDAQSATSTSAALAMSCTFGSKRWIVALVTKSPPVSKSVVLRMNLNHTFRRRPTLSSRILATTRLGWTIV